MSHDSLNEGQTQPGAAPVSGEPGVGEGSIGAVGWAGHDSIGDSPTSPGGLAPIVGRPGDRVAGKYEIVELLGRGGMGIVYRCRDMHLGRAVAVKRLRSDKDLGPVAFQRFKREADTIAQLAHPNIVALLDAGEDEAGPYLVMELLAGFDLHRFVAEQGPLSSEATIEVAKQACRALAFAHGNKLIHRDIKPKNLQRLPDGTIKLLDFGIARADDNGLNTGAGLGTADFAAPEQRLEAAQADARSDLYSLGATLYYLLHGHASFHEGCAASTPPFLRDLIGQLLKRDPRERPASAEAVLARLSSQSTASSASSGAARAVASTGGTGVTCWRCDAPNLPGTRYCVDCGSEVNERCYKCNEPDLQRRRYCAHCRADLQARRHYETAASEARMCGESRRWAEAAQHWHAALEHCPDETAAKQELDRCEESLRTIETAWESVRAAEQGLDVAALRKAAEQLQEILPPDDAEVHDLCARRLPAVADLARNRDDAYETHVRRARNAESSFDWDGAESAWEAAGELRPGDLANQGAARAKRNRLRIPALLMQLESAANALDLAALEQRFAELQQLLPHIDPRLAEWREQLLPRTRSLHAQRAERIRQLRSLATGSEEHGDLRAAAAAWRELCDVDPTEWQWQQHWNAAKKRLLALDDALSKGRAALASMDPAGLQLAVDAARTSGAAADPDVALFEANLAEWDRCTKDFDAQARSCAAAIESGRYAEAEAVLATLDSATRLPRFEPVLAGLHGDLAAARTTWLQLLHFLDSSDPADVPSLRTCFDNLRAHAPAHPELAAAAMTVRRAEQRRTRRRAVAVACALLLLVVLGTIWHQLGVARPRQAVADDEVALPQQLDTIAEHLDAHRLASAGRLLSDFSVGPERAAQVAKSAQPSWLPLSSRAVELATRSSRAGALADKRAALDRQHTQALALAEQLAGATWQDLAQADLAKADLGYTQLLAADTESAQAADLRTAIDQLRPIGAELAAAVDAMQRGLDTAQLDASEAASAKYAAAVQRWNAAWTAFGKPRASDTRLPAPSVVARVADARRAFDQALRDARAAVAAWDEPNYLGAVRRLSVLQAGYPPLRALESDMAASRPARMAQIEAAGLAVQAMQAADLQSAARHLQPLATSTVVTPELAAARAGLQQRGDELQSALATLDTALRDENPSAAAKALGAAAKLQTLEALANDTVRRGIEYVAAYTKSKEEALGRVKAALAAQDAPTARSALEVFTQLVAKDGAEAERLAEWAGSVKALEREIVLRDARVLLAQATPAPQSLRKTVDSLLELGGEAALVEEVLVRLRAMAAGRVAAWADVLELEPRASVIADAEIRARISGTGLPWKVRDRVTGIELVLIPPGKYMRGASPNDSQASADERPVHEVTISKAHYLGVTEVTQSEWSKVMGANPSYFKGDSLPVEGVSWDDIQPFLKKSGGLRLPTEGEWEYACRAGTTGSRYGELDDVAWYDNNSINRTHAVGGKRANAFGLHDMLGNVWEWCSDWYGDYSSASQTDPQGPSKGNYRVLRGGSWDNNDRYCRASNRYNIAPAGRNDSIGFRVARTP
jgi:formylglycine-generating enzyme required for sulfatase activity